VHFGAEEAREVRGLEKRALPSWEPLYASKIFRYFMGALPKN